MKIKNHTEITVKLERCTLLIAFFWQEKVSIHAKVLANSYTKEGTLQDITLRAIDEDGEVIQEHKSRKENGEDIDIALLLKPMRLPIVEGDKTKLRIEIKQKEETVFSEKFTIYS